MSENLITICGCGWLGLPLAGSLIAQGFSVSGTCRSEQKRNVLQRQGIRARRFELGEAIPNDIWQQATLILNLPPGPYRHHSTFFIDAMLRLIDVAKRQGCEKVLFVSTTAVYGALKGRVTELSQVKPLTASAQAHVQIEQEILKQDGTVLRLAGLIGPGRHPVRHLAGKKQISGGANPVNLVHQQDVINTIIHILNQQRWGKVFHLAASAHPSRAEYYRWAAEQTGLMAPEFEPDSGGDGKRIDASATLDMLQLQLVYPSPFQMPIN